MIFHERADGLRRMLNAGELPSEFGGLRIEVCPVSAGADDSELLWHTDAWRGPFRPPDAVFGTPPDQSCMTGLDEKALTVPPRTFRRIRDARIVGNNAVVGPEGRLHAPMRLTELPAPKSVIHTNNYQGFVLAECAGQTLCAFARRDEPLDFVEDAVFFHNIEPGNYGSFLFRQLPQIMLFRRFLEQTPDFKFTCYVLPSRTTWLLEAIRLAGLPERPSFEISQISGDRFQSVSLFNAFDAEGFLTEDMRQDLRLLVERASRCRRVEPARRIYVSRRLHEVRRRNYRRLRNAAVVEAAFAEAGFMTVYPESLVFQDQVSLFASANCIAGPSGSGMLTSMLANDGTKVLDIESFTNNVRQHAKIYSSTGKIYAFLFGLVDTDSSLPLAARNWELPPELLNSALQWFRSPPDGGL